jgi:hypothetical protein
LAAAFFSFPLPFCRLPLAALPPPEASLPLSHGRLGEEADDDILCRRHDQFS